MKTESGLRDLKQSMKREVELLEAFATEEQKLQNAIVEREWERLEEIVDTMSTASEEVLEAETERHRCYTTAHAEAGCGDEESFYDFVSRLDLGERTEISELYRRLKIAVMRVQALTGGIGSYVTSATTAVREILDELYPQRKGRIYSSGGHHSSPDERALVLDRHL